ncbi:hypothetical protein EON63_13715, partial [archaeon]
MAIQSLFQHRIFLPRFPFQSLIPSLLHHDVNRDLLHSLPRNYFSIPSHALLFTVQIAKFGATDFVGSKHLAKFISSQSLTTLRSLTNTLHELLGAPSPTLTTDHITAHFVEVYPFYNALSSGFSLPKTHRLDMILEVYITATSFDECLNVFIRRVLEDAHKVHVGLRTLSGDICIHNTHTGVMQNIEIYTMRTKAQSVRALLKAAVLNEHEISLHFYLLHEHTLSVFEPCFKTYREPSKGWICITRKYKLTYTDTAHHIRCFTRFPLESLILGMFVSIKEAELCVQAYTHHMSRLEQNLYKKADTISAIDIESLSDNLLHDYIAFISNKIFALWEKGEYVECMCMMYVLVGIFESNTRKPVQAQPPSHTPTHTQAIHTLLDELKVIQCNKPGHLNVIRQIVSNFRASLSLYIKQCMYHAQILNNVSRAPVTTLNEDDRLIVQKYTTLLPGFSAAIFEIKQLVQEVCLSSDAYTEMHYVRNLLLCVVGRFFVDSVSRTRNKLEVIQDTITSNKRVLTNEKLFGELVNISYDLEMYIKAVENNIAVECVYAIILTNVQSYVQAIQHGKAPKKFMYVYRNVNAEVPKCLLDILGFVYGKQIKKSTKMWRPMDISSMLYVHAEATLPYKTAPSMPHMQYQSDLHRLLTFQENSIHMYTNIYDVYMYMNAYNIYRYSALNYQRYAQREIVYGDMPSVILTETAKLRYLRDLNVLQGIQQARFDAIVCPTQLPSPLALHQSLLAYAAKLEHMHHLQHTHSPKQDVAHPALLSSHVPLPP